MEKKTDWFKMRISPKDRDRLQQVAHIQHKSMSALIVDLVRSAHTDALARSEGDTRHSV